jgi:hypothetical protein
MILREAKMCKDVFSWALAPGFFRETQGQLALLSPSFCVEK